MGSLSFFKLRNLKKRSNFEMELEDSWGGFLGMINFEHHYWRIEEQDRHLD